jgi:hypothetical protein
VSPRCLAVRAVETDAADLCNIATAGRYRILFRDATEDPPMNRSLRCRAAISKPPHAMRSSGRSIRQVTLAIALLVASLGTAPRASAAAPAPIPVDDRSFGCISALKPVRGYFVGNLLGRLSATLKVAQSKTGGIYPAGSVVQLVPTEVMVKQPPGFSPATHDWEFFELDVSKDSTKIRKRGFAEVVNRFGGNCFACHVKARPKWDFVCETGHGCDPIPLTEPMIGALQRTDPRCKGSEHVSEADAAALRQLSEMVQKKPAAPGGG